MNTLTFKLLLTEPGLILLNDTDGIVSTIRFLEGNELKIYSDIKNGIFDEEVTQFVNNLPNLVTSTLEVSDESLLNFIGKSTSIDVHYSDYDMSEINSLFLSSGFFSSQEDIQAFLRNFSLNYSKQQISTFSGKDDLQIIEGINSLDEIDKAINILMSRINEWYGLHFPELNNIIKDSEVYFKFVSLCLARDDLTEEHFKSFNFSENKINAILQAAETSNGGDITSNDLLMISTLSDSITSQIKVRTKLSSYINTSMNKLAPNLSSIAGETIGARLIAKSGSLLKLARLPSSTIQVLGAEKALFRSLKSGTRPPKHGLIFQHDKVHSSPKWQRGKIARSLSGKIAIATRIDAFRGTKADDADYSLDKRLAEIQAKYSSPSSGSGKRIKNKQHNKNKRRDLRGKRRTYR